MRGAPCAPLLLCLLLFLPPLLWFLLSLFNRFVDSNLYLAYRPFPAQAALGRQIIKISISSYAGQRSLLFFAEQGLFQFGLAACLSRQVGICGRLQGPGSVRMRPLALRYDRGQARRIIRFSGRKHGQYCFPACP